MIGVLGKDSQYLLGNNHRQRNLMALEDLVNGWLMKFQQNLSQSDGQYGMRKFLPVFDGLLSEHSWEMLPHKGVEISIALAGLEIWASEEGKGNDNLKQSLLIVDTILQTVKGGYTFEQFASGLLAEVLLI